MCVLHTISFFLPVDMMGMNTRTHTRPRVHSIKFTNSTNEAVDLLWLPVTPIPRNSSEKKMTLPSSKIRKKRREKTADDCGGSMLDFEPFPPGAETPATPIPKRRKNTHKTKHDLHRANKI